MSSFALNQPLPNPNWVLSHSGSDLCADSSYDYGRDSGCILPLGRLRLLLADRNSDPEGSSHGRHSSNDCCSTCCGSVGVCGDGVAVDNHHSNNYRSIGRIDAGNGGDGACDSSGHGHTSQC